MKSEINGGRRLRKRGNCYTIHNDFTLIQSITHIDFSDLLNPKSCGFALLLAECGAGYDLCDVSRIPKSTHTKDGSPKEKLDQPTGCGPRPSTPVRWTPASVKRRVHG